MYIIKKQKSSKNFFNGDDPTTYDKVTVKITSCKFSYWIFLLIHNIRHANLMTSRNLHKLHLRILSLRNYRIRLSDSKFTSVADESII